MIYEPLGLETQRTQRASLEQLGRDASASSPSPAVQPAPVYRDRFQDSGMMETLYEPLAEILNDASFELKYHNREGASQRVSVA